MAKFHVTTHDGREYDVTAHHIEVDENNSNRITFYDAKDKTVAQENNAAAATPTS